MVRQFSVACALCLTLVLAGCKNDAESAMSDVITKMNDITGVLKGVTDKASADAALPKLKALGEEMKAIQQKSAKVSEADGKKAVEKYGPQLKEATEGMQKEMMRVAMISPEVLSAVSSGMGK